MRRSRVGTLVVIDDAGKLKGLLTERDIRFYREMTRAGGPVASRMTPLDRLVVHEA